MSDKEKILRAIYYDAKNPSGFSTAEKLYYAAKELIPNLHINDVRVWLSGELTYTLHKPVRKRFTRNPIIVEHIDQQWEADLVEMQEFQKDNKKYRYILTVIDVMSKYAWVEPLIDKKMESIINAFKKIFKKGRKPVFLRTDQGKEFVNVKFKEFLKKEKVYHFTSKNQLIKCAIVERFNRTLKSRMYKYFTAKGTRKWVDVLPDLVLAYNNSRHKTIKMTPVEASEESSDKLFELIYGVKYWKDIINKKSKDIKIGETIRKPYKLGKFDKSFYPNWSDQIYKIETEAKESAKPVYNIQDDNKKRDKQRYYPEEIQKVKPNLYRVEKVIRSRTYKKNKQYLVKWLDYPDSFNSWVDAKDMITLEQS